eukprot:GFKZ01005790.1.p1 GENE.GFKZ01005790.1~~GFKZ01005790.1.p1  ORF type:complete len:448 (-),score=51.16 GFKZ01005790.1:457-1800(-)
MLEEQQPSVGRHRRLANSEDSDDDTSAPQAVLTAAKADEFRPRPYRLIARGKGFTSMHDMSRFDNLDYVDLAANALTSLDGLASNFRLKTLIARQNKLTHIDPLLNHDNLQVLDISDNHFCSTEWLLRARFASNLIALVCRGNSLVRLEALAGLHSIQSLVVSNNNIEDISSIMQLTSLTKLSASNNQIRIIPDSISNLRSLRELRLAHNRISSLPPSQTLSNLSTLTIVDLGHNRLTSLQNLASCTALTHVNVRGNPACASVSDITESIQQLCPRIEVIDGKRIAGGRRKLRINRQRLAAGLPLEPERKYARPPSAYYVKKAQTVQNFDGATAPDSKRQLLTGGSFDRKRKAETSKETADEARSNQWQDVSLANGERSEDDALDAQQFVQMAKSQNQDGRIVRETQPNEPQRRESKKNRSKRRRVYEQKVQSSVRASFGGGGESQW